DGRAVREGVRRGTRTDGADRGGPERIAGRRPGEAVQGGGGGGDRRPARLLRAGERRPGGAPPLHRPDRALRPAAPGEEAWPAADQRDARLSSHGPRHRPGGGAWAPQPRAEALRMIAAVALLLAAVAPLPEAAPSFLALEATPEQVALGDLVEVRLVVEHDGRDVYSLPAFDPSPMATPKGAAAPRSRRSDL